MNNGEVRQAQPTCKHHASVTIVQYEERFRETRDYTQPGRGFSSLRRYTLMLQCEVS